MRPVIRQGRRPKVNSLGPQGSVQLWDPKSLNSIVHNTQVSSSVETEQDVEEIPRSSQASQFRAHMTYRRRSPSPYNYQITFVELEMPFDDAPGVMDRFYKSYDFFMFGPSFAPQLRAALQHCYACSPILLQDILIAIQDTPQCTRFDLKPANAYIAKGALSLEKLRTASITGSKDAFAIIALGQTLAAFDLLTNCIASTFILRYSLSSVKAWYGAISNNPELDSVSISSILWDTVSCLVKREVPVIRYIIRDSQIVDRMAGLCTTLMPILYDLCVASNKLKSTLQTGLQADTTSVARIQKQLFFWTPEAPPDLAETYSNDVIIRIEAQTQMFRTAGLLICHRIQHPIGALDNLAASYANEILLAFYKYSTLLSPGTRLQNVAFPILMAALENPDIPKEIWAMIDLSVASPACAEKLLALIEHVWMQRDGGSRSYLFDLIDDGPAFVVIP